ncbi:hypothetical protein OAS19_02460 [Altererythrobacter sp.]|nr:hypothetical protein [Altererythrobacter sp.]
MYKGKTSNITPLFIALALSACSAEIPRGDTDITTTATVGFSEQTKKQAAALSIGNQTPIADINDPVERARHCLKSLDRLEELAPKTADLGESLAQAKRVFERRISSAATKSAGVMANTPSGSDVTFSDVDMARIALNCLQELQ